MRENQSNVTIMHDSNLNDPNYDEAGENQIAKLRQFYKVDQHVRYRNDHLQLRQKRFIFGSFIALATTVVHAVKVVKKGVELVKKVKEKARRAKEIVGRVRDGINRGKEFVGRIRGGIDRVRGIGEKIKGGVKKIKDGVEYLSDPENRKNLRKKLMCKLAPDLEGGLDKLADKAINKTVGAVNDNFDTSYNASNISSNKPKAHLLQDKCKEKEEEEETPADNEDMSETVEQVDEAGEQVSLDTQAIMGKLENLEGAVADNKKAIENNFAEIQKNGEAIAQNAAKLDANRKAIEANGEAIAVNKEAILHNTELLDRNFDAIQGLGHQMHVFEKNVSEKFEKTFEHFKEIEKELRNIVLSIEVAKNEIIDSINFTRKEIIENISKARTGPIISHLNTFFNHFTTQSNSLAAGTFQERISKLEEDNGILHFFENAMRPVPGSLHTLLTDIINEKMAIPNNEMDGNALTMMELLNLGTLVYSSITFFLIQQFSVLLKYYSDKNDLIAFNRNYLRMFSTFKDFYITLVDKGGFFDKVTAVYEEIQGLPYVDEGLLREKETKLATVNQIFVIQKMIKAFADTGRSLQLQIPEQLKVRLDFSASKIKTPILDWAAGKKVRYAIQYYGRDNSTIPSIVSEWSRAYTVTASACPLVQRIPIDPYNRVRIIYRQFDSENPKIVAILNNTLETNFRDVHRDLFDAVSEPNKDISLANTKLLLNDNGNPNEIFENERRAIHSAVENENMDVLKMLVAVKADVDARDSNGISALYQATDLNNTEIVKLLIENKANVNVQTNGSLLALTPLHKAAYKNYVEITKLFLKQESTDVNLPSSDGSRPLHFAASFNKTSIVSLLLADSRVDVNAQMTKNHFTPLHMSTVNNNTEVIKLLLEQSGRVNVNALAKDLSTPLHLAAIFKNGPIAQQLLAAGGNALAKTAKGSLALHYAAVSGGISVVEQLVEASKQSINEPNGQQLTPLYLAYQYNHTDVAAVMLNNCANLNTKLKFGQSLLHVAAENGHIKAVRNLVYAGLSVNQTDELGNAPLSYAVANGHYTVARFLLESGSSINFANPKSQPLRAYQSSGEDALFFTKDKNVIGKQTEVGHFENATSNNFFDYYNFNPLLAMAVRLPTESDAHEMSSLLIQFGADANAPENEMHTESGSILSVAVKRGFNSVVKLLLENGAQVVEDTRRKKMQTSTLNEACASVTDDVSLVELLILHKADPFKRFDQKDYFELPMHEAARFGNVNLVKYLIHLDESHINDTASNGKTIFDYAVESPHTHLDLIKFLIGKKVPYLTNKNLVVQASLTNTEVATFLINNGTECLKYSEKLESSPIKSAIQAGSRELVELLLRKGASAENKLNLAVEGNCDMDTIRMLASKDPVTKYDKTLMNESASRNRLDVVKFLMKDLKMSFQSNSLFHAISGKGDLDFVWYFDSQNIDLTAPRIDNDVNLLHAALGANKTDIARYLIGRGLFQSVPECGYSVSNGTYLHLAASQDNLELTRFFVENGCNSTINKVDSRFGETPLGMAIAREGQLAVVKYLIEKGANLNELYQNSVYQDYTLLSQAIYRKKYDIAKLLVESGKVDLLKAAKNSESVILYEEYSLKEYTTSIVTENQQMSPQMLAMLRQNTELLNMIISKSKVREYLPFQTAIKMKNYHALAYYLFNEHPTTGETLLHESVLKGNLEEVQFILERGGNVNAVDRKQTTALHLATAKGDLEIVKVLLKSPCINLLAKNSQGKTPLDIANESKNQNIIEVFESVQVKKNELGNFKRLSSSADVVSNQVNLNNFDFNGTLFLLDTFIRKKTRKAYIPSPGAPGLPESDARADALNLVGKFENLIKLTASQVGVSYQPVDNFKLYQSIEKALLAGHFENIDGLLTSAAESAFSESVRSSKSFKKLLKVSIEKLIKSVQKQAITDQFKVNSLVTSKSTLAKLYNATTKTIDAVNAKNNGIKLIQQAN